MTVPIWPFGDAKMSFDGESAVPQAAFQPDFGAPITRPRATAMQSRVSVSVMFYTGNFAAFQTWWAGTARGGRFITKDPRTDADTILQPVGGAFSFRTIIGKNAGAGLVEIVHVTFSADLLPAVAP